MARSKHYSKANFLWSNVAYCDQWNRVMVVYDERDNLRAVIKEADNDDSYYTILLIGDNKAMLYKLSPIELGSTGKNMDACFKIYCKLQYEDTPSYVPSYRRTERIELYQVFPHTRTSARRTGGFHVTTDDLSDRINNALERYKEIIAGGVETINCISYSDYDDDDDYDDGCWWDGYSSEEDFWECNGI